MQLHLPSRLFLASTLALASCSSTGLSDTWIDPSVKSVSGFKKLFVAYRGTDASVQRVAEDAMAAHIRSAEVGRCYELFPDSPGMDPMSVKSRLLELGFDAAVVMRVSGVRHEVTWTPNTVPTYRSFGGYWGEPYSAHTDEIVHVETNLYSLVEDKLLYAARSETFNPSSTAELVDEIAVEIMDDLEEKGVLRRDREH